METKLQFAEKEISALMERVFTATVANKVAWTPCEEGDVFYTKLPCGTKMEVVKNGEVTVVTGEDDGIFDCRNCPYGMALYHLLCSKEYQSEVDELRKFVDKLCPESE